MDTVSETQKYDASLLHSKNFPDNLPTHWKKHLSAVKEESYFKKLTQFLNNEYQTKKSIYPQKEFILRALQSLDYDQVKIVILGQDPYHGPNQAIGLSFAVPNALKPKPPSLMNIFKEVSSDLRIDMSKAESELSGWVQQGVLLLNTVLTVRAQQAFSHRDQGWEQFTDNIISHLNARQDPIIFILWGSAAQKKKELIKGSQHFIIESAHPSPLSSYRGFFGSKPFSRCNEILLKLNKKPIDWGRTG